MRDPKRLDSFYDAMKSIHKKCFTDWRFGQLMMNFLNWVYSEKGVDPFFPEEDRMITYFREYASSERGASFPLGDDELHG